ncbi:hypothetical protein ACWPM1_01200 [Tsuneonella sp. HG249]
MNPRTLILPLIALGAVAAAPPLEADSESATQAERRLRACVSANASGHGTIEAAILHTRAACKPQINDLRDVRIIAVTSGLEPDAARVAEQRVTRELNNEIAHAIANFSGLAAPHAHD